jgi:hypothetical protein
MMLQAHRVQQVHDVGGCQEHCHGGDVAQPPEALRVDEGIVPLELALLDADPHQWQDQVPRHQQDEQEDRQQGSQGQGLGVPGVEERARHLSRFLGRSLWWSLWWSLWRILRQQQAEVGSQVGSKVEHRSGKLHPRPPARSMVFWAF